MKKITILLSAFALFVSFVGCSNSGKTDKRITEPASISQSVTQSAANQKKTTQQSKNTMHIKINNKDFTAEIYDNETANAFADMLPLTLDMNELHGNEKYYYFDHSLPAAPSNVKEIHSGDIMLYGTDCLVLFYDNFSTSYRYTTIGRITNSEDLAEIVASGNATITFSLIK